MDAAFDLDALRERAFFDRLTREDIALLLDLAEQCERWRVKALAAEAELRMRHRAE